MRIRPIAILLAILWFCSPAAAACRPSPAVPPRHFMGLQLLHGEDDIGWKYVADLKPDWVRLELHWFLMEPEPDQFDWRITDMVMAQAASSKANIMLLINSMPDWAVRQPHSEQAFGNLLANFFARYKDRLGNIKAYEIFNEPNNPGFGWLSANRSPESNQAIKDEDSARLFATYLRTANGVIREYDTTAFIVSGGLFSRANASSYAQEVLKQDVADCFDVVGYHPYEDLGHFAKRQQELERETGKPVWMTEYGTTDNRQRADILRQTFAELPNLNGLFWYLDRDFGIFSETYGLADYFGHPKPDYRLFKHLQAATMASRNIPAATPPLTAGGYNRPR